jgi:hypothetical protein
MRVEHTFKYKVGDLVYVTGQQGALHEILCAVIYIDGPTAEEMYLFKINKKGPDTFSLGSGGQYKSVKHFVRSFAASAFRPYASSTGTNFLMTDNLKWIPGHLLTPYDSFLEETKKIRQEIGL